MAAKRRKRRTKRSQGNDNRGNGKKEREINREICEIHESGRHLPRISRMTQIKAGFLQKRAKVAKIGLRI